MADAQLQLVPDPPADAPPVEEPSTDVPAQQAEAPPAPAEDPWQKQYLSTSAELKQAQREARKTAKRLAELEARATAADELDALWKDDPLAALERRGVRYDDITKRVLEQTATPEELERRKMAQRVEQLERERQEEREQAQRAAYDSERQANLRAVQAHVEGSDALAYSAALGLSGELLRRLEAHVQEHGDPPDAEEQEAIASQLEAEARDHTTAALKALAKSPERRGELRKLLDELDAADAPAEEEPDPAPAARKPAAPRTVTRQQMAAGVTRTPPAHGESIEERARRGKQRLLERLGR